jgi:hypothetical protein
MGLHKLIEGGGTSVGSKISKTKQWPNVCPARSKYWRVQT